MSLQSITMCLDNDPAAGYSFSFPEDEHSETSNALNNTAPRNEHQVPEYLFSAAELLQAGLRLRTCSYDHAPLLLDGSWPSQADAASPTNVHSSTPTAPASAATAAPVSGTIITRPYAATKDWEDKKVLIQSLYLDQNLNLQDLMDIMESRHQFRATPKMYKTQFTKWKWRKYRSAKTSVCNANPATAAKSCLRRPDLRRKAMLNADTGTFLVNRALSALRDLFQASIDKYAVRSTGSTHEAWPTSTLYPFADGNKVLRAVSKYLVPALENFHVNNTVFAGALLRRAFLEIENALDSEPDLEDLVLWAMTELASERWAGILTSYLAFLAKYSAQKSPRHPVAQIATSLHGMLSFEKRRVLHYLSAAWELWRDSTIGPTAHSLNPTHSSYLITSYTSAQSYLGITTVDIRQQYHQQLVNYKEYLLEAEESGQALSAAVYVNFLALQEHLEVYLDDFIPLLNWLFRALWGQNAHHGSFQHWERLDKLQHLIYLHKAIKFYLHREQYELALTHSSTAIQIIRENPELHDIRFRDIISLEHTWNKHGFDEHASELRELYQESPLITEDLALVKRLEEIDLGI